MESFVQYTMPVFMALFLFQMITFMNEAVVIDAPLEEVPFVRIDHFISNSASHHIYPYLASFITFVCIFVSLMMVICYAPLLGR